MEIIERKEMFCVATQRVVGIDVVRIWLPTILMFTTKAKQRDMRVVEGPPREHIVWLRNDRPVKQPELQTNAIGSTRNEQDKNVIGARHLRTKNQKPMEVKR